MRLIELSFLAKTRNPPLCLSSSYHSWRRPEIHRIHRFASHRVVIPGEDQESTGLRLIELSFLAKTRNPQVCVSSSCHSWRSAQAFVGRPSSGGVCLVGHEVEKSPLFDLPYNLQASFHQGLGTSQLRPLINCDPKRSTPVMPRDLAHIIHSSRYWLYTVKIRCVTICARIY